VAREVQEGWTLEPMAHEPERDPACAFLCSDRSFRNKTMFCCLDRDASRAILINRMYQIWS
jgi:hypothetical protein